MARLRLAIRIKAFRSVLCGQGTVEFALVIPVFVLIVFGLVDLGRGVAANTAVSNGAHEAARAGIYPNTLNSSIETALNTQTALIGHIPVFNAGGGPFPADGNYATVSPDEGARTSGLIAVTVRYRLPVVTPVISSLIGSSINLSATSRMPIEQ